MKYFVCKHADIDKLCRHVNKLIDEGWFPQGGIAVCDVPVLQPDGVGATMLVMGTERHYAQAMVAASVRWSELPNNSG